MSTIAPKVLVLDERLYAAEVSGGFGPRKPGDAGVDLRSTMDLRIEPFTTVKIPLGVCLELPEGTVGWMTGRSSLTTSYGALTHEGKIDRGYRGEVHHIISALRDPVQLNRGDRICQLVVVRINEPGSAFTHWDLVTSLSDSLRGKRGLGSTGRD